jgi:hypothetical protein
MTCVSAGIAALVLSSALLVACEDGDDTKDGATEGSTSGSPSASSSTGINPADFSATINNRFFPLEPGQKRVYEGEEKSGAETTKTRVEETVLSETETLAGVEVRVVEVKEFEDGELSEITKDYYAQHKDDAVYYFGERVDEYSNGQVSGHGGQWLAGEGQNQPGVFMPADPKVGDQFEQERAPGIAEDTSKVIVVGETVDVPAETASDCIKTEDYSPIDKVTEFKFYCPDIGLMREEFTGGFLDLVSMEPSA